jgi:SAM-dependent methyltransferase
MRDESGLTPDWSFLCSSGFDEKLQGHWNQMLWHGFAQFIPQGAKTLEIGCGTGKITAQAAKYRSSQAVGIDVLPQSIDYARGLADYMEVTVEFVLGSGFSVPFSPESFDVVLSEGVIEHFSRAETDRMVAEHARVCRPGGHVVISVPNLLNLPLTYHKLRAGSGYHAYPERSYTIWGLARLLRKHGLRPIAYSGLAPTIGLEWFIHKRLLFRWFDRWAPNWVLALTGYEVLVAAEKEV